MAKLFCLSTIPTHQGEPLCATIRGGLTESLWRAVQYQISLNHFLWMLYLNTAFLQCVASGYCDAGGGHWPRKRVRGCAALKTPFSRLSCSSQESHFKQKSQFTRPPFEKFGNFSFYSLNFHPNFNSQAPQIWKFSVHKPPNLEIFSSQAPKYGNFQFTSHPFQRQISVRKPHTSEIRAAHTYLKKSWVPPPGCDERAVSRFTARFCKNTERFNLKAIQY